MKRLILLACTFLLACGSSDDFPAPQVTVETVEKQKVLDTASYIATVTAINTIDLIPRVSGFLMEQHFAGGEDVKAGDLLYVIEPYEYIADVDQKEADLAKAKATLVNNELNYYRIQDLAEKDFASISDADQARADYETAKAQVKAAEADLFNAKLNLEYTRMQSPLDGRIGYSPYSVGDYVTPATGTLVTIVQLDPIYVNFSLNENSLLGVKLELDDPNQEKINSIFTPRVIFQNGDKYPLDGVIESMDNRINPGTGSITVRTRFKNPKALLLPGQFVNVVIQKGDERQSVVVPSLSVLYDKQGYYVLVVNDKDIVEARYIKEGLKTAETVEVLSGVNAGERVITEGLQKAIPGKPVKPVEKKKETPEKE